MSDRPTCGPERRAHLLSQIQREPRTAGLAADEDPYLGLIGVVSLREMAEALEHYQVQRAREAGFTWAQIAAALGVSAQAVHKKHAARLSGQGNRGQGDLRARVTATTDHTVTPSPAGSRRSVSGHAPSHDKIPSKHRVAAGMKLLPWW